MPGLIPSLTLFPYGDDRSVIRYHLPGVFFGMTPILLIWISGMEQTGNGIILPFAISELRLSEIYLWMVFCTRKIMCSWLAGLCVIVVPYTESLLYSCQNVPCKFSVWMRPECSRPCSQLEGRFCFLCQVGVCFADLQSAIV